MFHSIGFILISRAGKLVYSLLINVYVRTKSNSLYNQLHHHVSRNRSLLRRFIFFFFHCTCGSKLYICLTRLAEINQNLSRSGQELVTHGYTHGDGFMGYGESIQAHGLSEGSPL